MTAATLDLAYTLQSLLHAKTKLIIRDLGSKVGTSLDGQNIGKNATRTLDKSEHLIRLGSFEKGIRYMASACSILTNADSCQYHLAAMYPDLCKCQALVKAAGRSS